jgi:hypothetical protein
MAVDFAKNRHEAEAAGMLGSGDYFKLKEGKNRFRLLSECLPHPGEYQGKKNFKWLCYVLDRLDGKVKPFFMAHTIYKQIEALQTDDDYHFEDVPMPYDITITAKGAGTIDVEYAVIPSPQRKALTNEEYLLLSDAKPLADLQKMLREKTEKDKNPSDSKPETMYDDEGRPIPF